MLPRAITILGAASWRASETAFESDADIRIVVEVDFDNEEICRSETMMSIIEEHHEQLKDRYAEFVQENEFRWLELHTKLTELWDQCHVGDGERLIPSCCDPDKHNERDFVKISNEISRLGNLYAARKDVFVVLTKVKETWRNKIALEEKRKNADCYKKRGRENNVFLDAKGNVNTERTLNEVTVPKLVKKLITAHEQHRKSHPDDDIKLLLSNKDTDFRAIVFVRTRRGASILTNILNSHPELVTNNLKAEFIAGFNKNSETTRKTEQMDKLKRFRDGETRVLLSTSVADEGLDVVKCNLIIKYNYATNEIAHLQRKGRGRAKNSRSVLITQNVKLKEQEERNILKVRLMNFVMDAIQENRIDLSSLVENAIEKLWIEIQMEDAQVSERLTEQKSSNKLYKLLCSKCDEFLCTSKDIKTYKDTQFCVCDPDFWSRTYNENLNDADAMAKFGAIGKLHCKNCGNSIGRVLIIEGKTVPALGASAFVLEFTDSPIPTKRTVRKWSSVTKQYFTPDPIRNHDLMAMSRPLKQPVFTSDVSMAPCLLSQS
ncbi:ATP-dependent RNA helicase dbp2 [Parelaphostrongylus tenuis]|uniref:ATP-dependent RNA helicase dbp2 n=1 Tax=Parelaphostrongylus tenuis TaxID=148309 RepID=A0AAD5MNC3_PARTN|nr:ATP-dependent RNA helicase dbp2 [Parelaphostrongylus tenuis]